MLYNENGAGATGKFCSSLDELFAPKIKPINLSNSWSFPSEERGPCLVVDLSSYLQSIIFTKTVGCALREMFSTIPWKENNKKTLEQRML